MAWAASSKAVTCGSHGPGEDKQKLFVVPRLTWRLGKNLGIGPWNLLFCRPTFLSFGSLVSESGTMPAERSGIGPENRFDWSQTVCSWAIDPRTISGPENPDIWLLSINVCIPDFPNEAGRWPVMLLYESRRVWKFGRESNMSGIWPTTFALLAMKVVREDESLSVSGIVQAGRLVLFCMLKVWRLVRPERKPVGKDSKLFSSRYASWREGRSERGGSGPDNLLRWRLRVLRAESWVRWEGIVPVRDLDARLMEVTRAEESQLMPCHLQKFGPVQPGGLGLMDLANWAMTDASSAAIRWTEVENNVKRRMRRRRERNLSLSLCIV
ncbi:leucine-rich repeat protein kinase family protein, partial [Striga asiatica]